MTRFQLQKIHPIGNVSLALTASMLSILCLQLPALAQTLGSNTALPATPSNSSSITVSSATTGTNNDHSLTFGERANIFRRSALDPEAIVGSAFGAAIDQWEDEPPGWHGGAEGYGKRFGSGLAQHEIGETIRFGFAAVDHEDPRYFVSQDRAFGARTKHAILSTLVSQTSSGRTIPAFSRLTGAYGSAFIANTWYPSNRATAGDAAVRGSIALATSVGFNFAREFLPFFRRNTH